MPATFKEPSMVSLHISQLPHILNVEVTTPFETSVVVAEAFSVSVLFVLHDMITIAVKARMKNLVVFILWKFKRLKKIIE
jgi:hypothetical protein